MTDTTTKPRNPIYTTRWDSIHGVDVLLKIYAKCVDGQDEIAKRRIEAALAEEDEDDTR